MHGIRYLTAVLLCWCVAQSASAAPLCDGHGCRTIYYVRSGSAIDVAVTVTVGNITNTIVPSRQGGATNLGFVCPDTPITMTIQAKDPDEHVCQGVSTNTVYNYIPDSNVTVNVTDTNNTLLDIVPLQSTQGPTGVVNRIWTRTWSIPSNAVGQWLNLTFQGTVADQYCSSHCPASDDTDVDLSAYAAKLAVLKVDLDIYNS